jgi:hypothetical protein
LTLLVYGKVIPPDATDEEQTIPFKSSLFQCSGD